MPRIILFAAPLFAAPLLVAVLIAGAGCSRPKPIPTGVPPEPQATQLRDAMQAPLDKAKAVEGTLQDVDQKRRAELDASGE